MAANATVLQITEAATETIGQAWHERLRDHPETLRRVWETLREGGGDAFDPWGWTIPMSSSTAEAT